MVRTKRKSNIKLSLDTLSDPKINRQNNREKTR
jgi:hypothetical protein